MPGARLGLALLLAAALPAAAGRAVHHTTVGEIESYDTGLRIITLRAGGGAIRLPVASDATVWWGTVEVPLILLEGHAGCRAAVTYTTEGDQKTAHTVRFLVHREHGRRPR